MNSSVLLCLFSFLLLSSLPFSLCEETTSQSQSQTTTPLDHLCNNLGGFYITPDYCFNAFAADSRSRTADYNFLALISLNFTISNATNVRSNINSLLTSTTFSSTTPSSEPVRKGLQTCLKLYDDVISSLKWSAQSVSAGRYLLIATRINSDDLCDFTLLQPKLQAVLFEIRNRNQIISFKIYFN